MLKWNPLHWHSEYSLQDGMIHVADRKDPKHVKSECVLYAEEMGCEAITFTDHGNMYAHAKLAQVCKTFGFKHIPGCEFYVSPTSRNDKTKVNGWSYWHMCGWAKNKAGYANMCRLQKRSFTEGFYSRPRIDFELINQFGDDIMWSDACVSGILAANILSDKTEQAKQIFDWMVERFKGDFYIEYQHHGIEAEDRVNAVKIPWANERGIPIIATTDSHYYKKDDIDAQKALLCIQWGKSFNDPLFSGFDGTGYHCLNEQELLEIFPTEYINNTQLVVDKVEEKIIEFGDVVPPSFRVPQWFVDKVGQEEIK